MAPVIFEWDEEKREGTCASMASIFPIAPFPCERRESMSKRSTSTRSRTDWKRIDAMRDEDIDLSDCPEGTAEDFARAIVREGLKPIARKQQITLRVDSDVLDWFRARGAGYQTQINALLRAYMEEHQKAQSRRKRASR
jgi:uncharacterized protein (DUF4415 family)